MIEIVKGTAEYSFLKNTGEIGELVAEFDWSRTRLGDMDQWPESLKINLGNILHSSFPMFLFWGEDFHCFYNEAFRPSLGAEGKHPAIGKKAIVVWGEIWHIIGPMLQRVFLAHEPVFHEDLLVPFYRDGKVENIYWTFCYSPAYGEEGKVMGVVVTCMETTKQVLERLEKERSN